MSTLVGLGVSVGVVGAGLASTPAFADTGFSNYTCTNPGGSPLSVPIDVTGTVTPANTVAGDGFDLSNYQVVVDITASLATTLAAQNVTSMSGTAAIPVEATNATPTSIPVSATWNSGPISAGVPIMIDIPSTPLTEGPFTPISGAGPPVLSTGALPTTVTVNGSFNVSSTCTPPNLSPTIDSASLNMTGTASASSIVAGTPSGVSDTVTVAGNAASGAPTGTVTFRLCGVGVDPCGPSGTEIVPPESLTPGSDAFSSATSATVATPSTPGTYCFFALFSDGGSPYPLTGVGDNTQCFTVTPPISCIPSCTGTVSSAAGTVSVSGTSLTPANLFLSAGPATLNCGSGFNAQQQYTTVQEGSFTSVGDLTVVDTVDNVSSLKKFGVCLQTFSGTFRNNHGAHVTVGLLHKCKTGFPAPCIVSTRQSGDSVIATLSIPPNDPRFHGGGPAPEVTSITPTVALPGHTVVIKGLNLKKATVKVGSKAAVAKAKATSITVTIPSGIPSGFVPITITTPTGGSTVYRNFATTATAVA